MKVEFQCLSTIQAFEKNAFESLVLPTVGRIFKSTQTKCI